MHLCHRSFLAVILTFLVGATRANDWVEPMKAVHARFKGEKCTIAHFGDSITVTLAYWAPLAGEPRNMDAANAAAHTLVKRYQKPDCWRGWKGPAFGNEGRMTIRWAHENVEQWLKKLNPEAVVLMFGSNDVSQLKVTEYEEKTREVVRRCLANGTVVILTTMPPRSGHVEKAKEFADAARRIAKEEKVPLVDYFAAIVQRRADDWDGSLPQFKKAPGNEYDVPTLIARDGVHPSNPAKWANDFSVEGLSHNGFTLRNQLTLVAYAEVISQVFNAVK